jgi:hypothetical protein
MEERRWKTEDKTGNFDTGYTEGHGKHGSRNFSFFVPPLAGPKKQKTPSLRNRRTLWGCFLFRNPAETKYHFHPANPVGVITLCAAYCAAGRALMKNRRLSDFS